MQNAMRRMCALKKIFYGAFLFHILNLGVVDIFFEKANLPGCGTVNALCGAELADEFIEFSLVLLMLLLACRFAEVWGGGFLVEGSDERVVATARAHSLFQAQAEVCGSCGKVVVVEAEATFLVRH